MAETAESGRHRRDESIPPARVATCEARVRHFGEDRRDEVLLRSGHLPARYEEERRSTTAAMTEEAGAQEETRRAEAYAEAFVAERRRLRREVPAIASLGELPASTAREEPAPAVAPLEPPAPLGEAPVAPTPAPSVPESPEVPRFVPSYLREAPSRPDVIPIHVASIDHDGPDSTQLPIRRAGPTLPFAEARAGEVPAAVRAASAVARAQRDDDRDHGNDDDGDGASEGGVDIDATAFLPRTVFEGPATPFEKKKVESAPTLALDGDALRAAAATPEPWVPLEEYAAFLGELAQDPSRAGFLRAKFGIAGEDAQRALGAAFAARFGLEPGLRERFNALVAAARAGAKR